MTRGLKQLIFGLIFIVIFGAISFGIYRAFQVEPTCFDKIQNQTEEGVDCGKVCGNTCFQSLEPIRVLSSNLFKIRELNGQIDYDALFRVYNPNTKFGSADTEFELKILGSAGDVILSQAGGFYILPGQTKYIYIPLLKTNTTGIRAELDIRRASWEKLEGVFNEEVRLTVKSKDYFANGKPGVSARVTGTIFNSSDFDFDKVDVVVVIFKNNIPIGANKTEMRTLLSKSDRFFEVDWVNEVPENPDRIDVEASTNVFMNSNFIRSYGTQEKFQQPF
ncbi:MAG: hypothetical protein A3I24_03105 [Candidatus Harrisonbacteria bacterium RIFCSPLOWO2_02_FULL_41_13b]|uniref:Uncharacterized protein n=1 Tax=Candidatus Harrisonbacteria bacterium RIFCSPLOWO2_02_FULL_41_13b TaxID=1798409 RepID=A0A1G1ZWN8_9BACT|nr:MAG: hypothetical protein A3I24_03105 [Candidatus Harrisonbacteria bacterium RIFCSPLOWO2_02_FULL_41_13b]